MCFFPIWTKKKTAFSPLAKNFLRRKSSRPSPNTFKAVNNRPFAKRMERMQRSTIREILKITKQPDIISFAGGLPAPELFPLETFQESLLQALRVEGAASLQYDLTEGYPPLKEFLCAWLTRHGLPCRPDEL